MSETQYYQKPTDEPVSHDSWDEMHPASHYIWWKVIWSQIRSITEATDCSALSSQSCNSHGQAAEVIAFLCCWLLRCHGCFLYRMGRGEWGARTAPPTQFSSHGFLPHSPPFISFCKQKLLSRFPQVAFGMYLSMRCSDFMTRAVITCTIPRIMALWAHMCQPLAKVCAAHLFLQLPYAMGMMLIPVLRVSKQAYAKWLA